VELWWLKYTSPYPLTDTHLIIIELISNMPGKRGKKGCGARSKACIGPTRKRRATKGCLEKKQVGEKMFVLCSTYGDLFCL
jgi:hypothetical protein